MARQCRRQFVRGTVTALALGVAGCQQPGDSDSTETATTDSPSAPSSVGLEPLTTEVDAPLGIAFPPDTDQQYILAREGRVFVRENGSLREEPLLDLRETVELGGEKGLLGIALHPDFGRNRRLFVRYSTSLRPEMPDDYSHTFVLAEFSVSEDGRQAQRSSEQVLLEIPQPQGNHNAGDLAFGPDGYLYVPVGDGGAGGDRGPGHVEDWYEANPGGNGQDVTENLLGSILRLDVDGESDEKPYAIPEDNPLVGRPGLDEQYAWGFRNPWRISFDGSRLFVGDVGQNAWEEIDLVRKGGNYGWNVREGSHCYRASDCPDETPQQVRGGEPLIDPIIEYPHQGEGITGDSVIGGAVYRGSAIPELAGAYVFGDLNANGRLFLGREHESEWETSVLDIADGSLKRLLAIGRDPEGELYVLAGRGVYRLTR